MGSSSSSLSSGSSSCSSSSSGSSSSSSNAREHGSWRYNETCNCDRGQWKCYQIYHQDINLVPDIANIAADALYDTAATHHCIKLRIQCENCGRVFYITAEHGTSGVRLHHGFYQREYKIRQNQPMDLYYDDVLIVYQAFSNRKYDFVSYNCTHFAYEFYRAVVELNTERSMFFV